MTKIKVTLINPPRYSISVNPFKSGGYIPNLGLLYLAASLEQADFKVCLIDAINAGFTQKVEVVIGDQRLFRYGLSYQQICQQIDRETRYIGISIPFSNSARIVEELACVIKGNFPHIPIIVGGVHASTLPPQSLTKEVDYVIVGEGEEVFTKLVSGVSPDEIDGIIYRSGNQIMDHGRAPFIVDLDNLPFPAFHLLDTEKILSVSARGTQNKRSLSIITSRGCPFDCEFCSVHAVQGYKWRPRSPENVLLEIRYYQENYQVNHIEFEDDNLTFLPERAEAIFEGMLTLVKPLTWSAHNGVRVDRLNYDLLKLMKKSGCTRLNLAIESGCENTLKLMGKKLSLDKVEEVVKSCAKLKISTTGFMLVGYPGETQASFTESIKFFRRMLELGLSEVAPFIVIPIREPGCFRGVKSKDF